MRITKPIDNTKRNKQSGKLPGISVCVCERQKKRAKGRGMRLRSFTTGRIRKIERWCRDAWSISQQHTLCRFFICNRTIFIIIFIVTHRLLQRCAFAVLCMCLCVTKGEEEVLTLRNRTIALLLLRQTEPSSPWPTITGAHIVASF